LKATKGNIKIAEIRKRINIAVHNINGLKGNRHKLEILVDKLEEEKYDLVGIVETNISEKEGQYIISHREKIDSFWTNAEKGKNKGSGVGILVSKNWSKHIGQIRKHSSYLLEVHFFFKQLELVVFIVYIAPNSQPRRKEVQRVVMREVAQRKPNMHFIVMGDFNHVIQPSIDKSNGTNNNFKKLPLHGWMRKQNFVDTFREMYPNKKSFSWSNGKDSTRIDQIWISESLNFGLKEALIEDMTTETGSDHSLVAVELLLDHLEFKDSLAQSKKKGVKRTIFLYDKATEENWYNYKNKLQHLLEKKLNRRLWLEEYSEENSDRSLDTIDLDKE